MPSNSTLKKRGLGYGLLIHTLYTLGGQSQNVPNCLGQSYILVIKRVLPPLLYGFPFVGLLPTSDVLITVLTPSCLKELVYF